jgi:hypothetical protein
MKNRRELQISLGRMPLRKGRIGFRSEKADLKKKFAF